MSEKKFHQNALDKAKERTATIQADQLAAQQGAFEHLRSVPVAVEDEPTTTGG